MPGYKLCDLVRSRFSESDFNEILPVFFLLFVLLLLSCVVETGFRQAFPLISLNPVQALSAWSALLGIGLGEIPMWKIVPASLVGWLLLSAAAMAACPVTYTFTNGTTADAGQVNTNFTDLTSCLAPAASPTFSGTATAPDFNATNSVSITGTNKALFFATPGWSGGVAAYAQAGVNSGGTGGGDYWLFNVPTGKSFSWAVNNASQVAIGSDGSFLVGTTSNGGWNGNFKAEVRSSTFGLSAYSTGSSGHAAFMARVDSTSNNFANFYFNGAVNVGSISYNGSATVYATSSDARLKSNVVDITAYKALRVLQAYRPQEYLLRGKPGFGALAQNVDQRLATLGMDAASIGVVVRGDSNLRLKEGEPGFRPWSMDSAKMVPFIIATSLDHEERLKALETENAALTRQVRDLARTVALLERGRRAERQAAAPARTRAVR